jgi:hypothetical protein
MSEGERLPKLKENSKLTKLKEEIYGTSEELLEEDELYITDINSFIYICCSHNYDTDIESVYQRKQK